MKGKVTAEAKNHWEKTMSENGLKMRGIAKAVLYQLPDSERQNVLAAVEKLRKLEPAQWPSETVVRLLGPDPLYLLRVPPDLRVFLRQAGPNEIEIEDVVREGLLETLAGVRNTRHP
jgi:hypothetical protein